MCPQIPVCNSPDLNSWRERTPPHSNARARLPAVPHARAVSAMAGILFAGADAAPLSPPPTPPAADGHGGGGADDNNTSSPLLDLVERCPDLFKKEVLERLDPIDRTFLAQTGSAYRAAVAASDLPRAGTRNEVLGKTV